MSDAIRTVCDSTKHRSSDWHLRLQTRTRKVRGLRHCGDFFNDEFHEALLLHRQPDCAAALRPRPGRVRPAARRTRAEGLHPPRLILLAEIGHPDLPRQSRTPSGSPPGGVLLWPFAKGFQALSRLHRAPRSIRTCWSEAGNAAKAHQCAVPGCFGTGGRRMHSRTNWPLRREANAEHLRTVRSGAGSQHPSGARGVAVAYAADRGEGISRWRR